MALLKTPSDPTKDDSGLILVEATVNGHKTMMKATRNQAKKNGWPEVDMTGKPLHKARPAPKPVTPTEPDPVEEAQNLEGLTVKELKAIAADLEIPGRSKLTTSAKLIEAINAAL